MAPPDPRPNHPRRSVQRSTISFIHDNNYKFTLPVLTTAQWNTIFENDAERERLEFIGDSIMNEAVAGLLVQNWPKASPHFYSVGYWVLLIVHDLAI